MARVIVDVMLKPEILDPQGEAVVRALPRLGASAVTGVRIGKRIELDFVEGTGTETMREQARVISDALLANPVIENFDLKVVDTDVEPVQ